MTEKSKGVLSYKKNKKKRSKTKLRSKRRTPKKSKEIRKKQKTIEKKRRKLSKQNNVIKKQQKTLKKEKRKRKTLKKKFKRRKLKGGQEIDEEELIERFPYTEDIIAKLDDPNRDDYIEYNDSEEFINYLISDISDTQRKQKIEEIVDKLNVQIDASDPSLTKKFPDFDEVYYNLITLSLSDIADQLLEFVTSGASDLEKTQQIKDIGIEYGILEQEEDYTTTPEFLEARRLLEQSIRPAEPQSPARSRWSTIGKTLPKLIEEDQQDYDEWYKELELSAASIEEENYTYENSILLSNIYKAFDELDSLYSGEDDYPDYTQINEDLKNYMKDSKNSSLDKINVLCNFIEEYNDDFEEDSIDILENVDLLKERLFIDIYNEYYYYSPDKVQEFYDYVEDTNNSIEDRMGEIIDAKDDLNQLIEEAKQKRTFSELDTETISSQTSDISDISDISEEEIRRAEKGKERWSQLKRNLPEVVKQERLQEEVPRKGQTIDEAGYQQQQQALAKSRWSKVGQNLPNVIQQGQIEREVDQAKATQSSFLTEQQKPEEKGFWSRLKSPFQRKTVETDLFTQSKTLPEGWEERESLSERPGETYYYDTTTGESQWEFPSKEVESRISPSERLGVSTPEILARSPPTFGQKSKQFFKAAKSVLSGPEYEKLLNQSAGELKALYLSYLNEYFTDIKKGEDLETIKTKYVSFVDKYYEEALKKDKKLLSKLKEV